MTWVCSSSIDCIIRRYNYDMPLRTIPALPRSPHVKHRVTQVANSIISHSMAYDSARASAQLMVRALLKKLWRIRRDQWIDPLGCLPSLSPSRGFNVEKRQSSRLTSEWDNYENDFARSLEQLSDSSMSSIEQDMKLATVIDVGNIVELITSPAVKIHIR